MTSKVDKLSEHELMGIRGGMNSIQESFMAFYNNEVALAQARQAAAQNNTSQVGDSISNLISQINSMIGNLNLILIEVARRL